MSVPVEWDRLDASGFRVTMKRSVRRVAWFLVLIGSAVIVGGVLAPMFPLILVGAVYLCVGGWNLWRPSVHGVLLDACALIAAGIFTGLSWKLVGGDDHMAKALFGGFMQILWGVKRIRLWALGRNTPDDPAAIAALERIVAALSKRNTRKDDTIAEFRTGRFGHHRNRLGFHSEGVVGLLEGGAVRLERRADIWIDNLGSRVSGRTLKVEIRMSDLTMSGTISVRHFERFERWKLGMAPMRSVAA